MGAKLPRGKASRATAVSSNGTLGAQAWAWVLPADLAVKASAVPASTKALARAMAGSRFLNCSTVVFILSSLSSCCLLSPTD
jgi:hypothetical protein